MLLNITKGGKVRSETQEKQNEYAYIIIDLFLMKSYSMHLHNCPIMSLALLNNYAYSEFITHISQFTTNVI